MDPDLLLISAMTLATIAEDGQPHSAPVYFAASRDLRFYFFSAPSSRHSQDLEHDPRAAASIYPECAGWQDIRGLQMEGKVQAVEPGAEWDKAWSLYADKFPFVSELKEIVAQNRMYVFIPTWVRWLDNRRGFGYKEEWAPA